MSYSNIIQPTMRPQRHVAGTVNWGQTAQNYQPNQCLKAHQTSRFSAYWTGDRLWAGKPSPDVALSL